MFKIWNKKLDNPIYKNSALSIYKGKSATPSENIFFRDFAKRLNLLFQDLGMTGTLLAFPHLKGAKKLDLDFLLLTEHSVTIIELKNYDRNGTVRLPKKWYFWDGFWFFKTKEGKEVEIKGGASHSPFLQLRIQRKKLVKELEKYKFKCFDTSHIRTGVIFQKEVSIENCVPDSLENSLFVADRTDYIEYIFDFIHTEDKAVKLTESNIQTIVNMFKVKPYKDLNFYNEKWSVIRRRLDALH